MNITRIVARRWIGAMANDPRAACHSLRGDRAFGR